MVEVMQCFLFRIDGLENMTQHKSLLGSSWVWCCSVYCSQVLQIFKVCIKISKMYYNFTISTDCKVIAKSYVDAWGLKFSTLLSFCFNNFETNWNQNQRLLNIENWEKIKGPKLFRLLSSKILPVFFTRTLRTRTANSSPEMPDWGILILLMDLRVLEMIKRLQFHL